MTDVLLRRRLIFSSPVTAENWEIDMVRHIQIAKAMGANMFEIDVPGTIEVPKKQAEGYVFAFSDFFGGGAPRRIEGDEWKDAAESTRKPQKVSAIVVSVWALTVENKEEAA